MTQNGFRKHPRPSNAKLQETFNLQHQALMQEAAKVQWLTEALKAEQARTIPERIWTKVRALFSRAPSAGTH